MTKYRVIAEKVVEYNVDVIKAGTFWQYHISSEGNTITMGLGCLSVKDALEGVVHHIENLEEVDRVRYTWKVEDED